MGKGEGDGGRELRNLGVEREGKFLSSFLMARAFVFEGFPTTRILVLGEHAELMIWACFWNKV